MTIDVHAHYVPKGWPDLEAACGGTNWPWLRIDSEREAMIIKMRYGLDDGIPKTLDQIGIELKVTRERIRQLEQKTMSKLRHPARAFLIDFRRES